MQNPLNMGYLGVKTIVDAPAGEARPARVDTGVWMVTRDNLSAPATQELLKPPVDRYLK